MTKNHPLKPVKGSLKTRRTNSSRDQAAAIRAHERNNDDAQRLVEKYADANQRPRSQANKLINPSNKLKITFLGGLEDVGEKNMAVIEYNDTAIILDCGINLSIDLPGINYEINDTAYLGSIKHKLKGYVITHGHLDHVGGLKHTVPKFPAPIYGSGYTIGVIEKSFETDKSQKPGFAPRLIVADADKHEVFKIGSMTVEFIRVTHSLPDATAVCIDTPVGRIIATGDFRLDPEPLDKMPTDTSRLKQLGEQGVLLLLSDSSYADAEGRVPTESTLQESFYDIIGNAPGRIFVAAFSSNMNRAQMIINAAVAAGRKVALDGRGMLNYAEIAVRQGLLKVPKGTIIPITQTGTVHDSQLLIMCTGGQGEPHASLQRMSSGDHKHIKLHQGDTVVVSSSPIPGNEVSYDQISNQLSATGVHLFRHPTHLVDGCGPLHVSGHARRDELREMLQLTKPKFFVPVHGGKLRRSYHAELGVQEGVARAHVLIPNNGDSFFFTGNSVEAGGPVPHGSLLIDQNGEVIAGMVVKDRLLLAQEGIVTIVMTIDKSSGNLLSSPNIISRGFVSLRDSDQLFVELQIELRRAVQQRFKRLEADSFKIEVRDHVSRFLFSQTGRSPLVIPVVNTVQGKLAPTADRQQQFDEMRARLLM